MKLSMLINILKVIESYNVNDQQVILKISNNTLITNTVTPKDIQITFKRFTELARLLYNMLFEKVQDTSSFLRMNFAQGFERCVRKVQCPQRFSYHEALAGLQLHLKNTSFLSSNAHVLLWTWLRDNLLDRPGKPQWRVVRENFLSAPFLSQCGPTFSRYLQVVLKPSWHSSLYTFIYKYNICITCYTNRSKSLFRYFQTSIFILIFTITLSLSNTQAQDFGQHGHVFPIAEPDLLTMLQSRLKHLDENDGLAKFQEQQRQRVQRSILRPHVVINLTRATTARRWHHDPSLTLMHDVKDHRGQVMHKAGTRINPLHYRALTKTLVFIDGDDTEQLTWFEDQYLRSAKPHNIILVKGAPLTLREQWQQPVYFDQHSRLIQKFGIQHVPAIIQADNDHFIIQEIILEKNS